MHKVLSWINSRNKNALSHADLELVDELRASFFQEQAAMRGRRVGQCSSQLEPDITHFKEKLSRRKRLLLRLNISKKTRAKTYNTSSAGSWNLQEMINIVEFRMSRYTQNEEKMPELQENNNET